MSEIRTATVLILAASRLGPGDVVAQSQNVSHKCLITLDGIVMLERVVRELKASKYVDRIFISMEDENLLDRVPALAEMYAKGEIQFVQSSENLFLSVTGAAREISDPFPLVITTADNALHTTEMIDYFFAQFFDGNPDAGIAMTPASLLLEAYPEGQRAFYDIKGGGWSSCNLYGLMTPKALSAAKAFEGGGQFGKNPQRILKAFGLIFMILYKYKLASIETLRKRLSKRWGIHVKLIHMPYADGPIDVDNAGDVVLAEKILKARRAASE